LTASSLSPAVRAAARGLHAPPARAACARARRAEFAPAGAALICSLRGGQHEDGLRERAVLEHRVEHGNLRSYSVVERELFAALFLRRYPRSTGPL
jgi:hypothetical protein